MGVIKEGSANYAKSKFNTIGGKLTLTESSLIFQAHAFNFGERTRIDLDLNQLVRCQSGKTNIVSGEIEVFDRYQNKYVFVVNGRKEWANVIEDQIIKHRNASQDKPSINTTNIVHNDNNLDKLKKLK